MSATEDTVRESSPTGNESVADINGLSPKENRDDDAGDTAKHSARFWAIIFALAFTSLCSALEGTIITSALPTITVELGGGNNFIWVPNAYFLSTIVMLPLMAQASNLFGRRWLTLTAVALFTLGSGICGGSNSQAMLIAGRVVQGLGGGGIALMVNIILTDMVPLRERGKYMAIVQMVSAVGAALGPFLGGLLTERSTWRWAFYINLPIGGSSMIALFIFLHLKKPEPASLKDKLSRIDFSGNAIFVASTVSILIGITWGGTVYPWSSYRVIVPLFLGFAGLGLFVAFEWTLARNPSLPRAVLMNPTAAAVLGVTFCHTICTYWAFYFMPVYFQSVKGISAFWSGVNTLPLFAGLFPFAMVGGALLSKLGRYKPLHLIGMAVLTAAYGIFSVLDQNSSTAAWACAQLFSSIGAGLMIAILLPAMQAPLDESLVALSTGVWTFIRGFATIWGVTIPAAIFNNECRIRADDLSNQSLAKLLSDGKAYQYATKTFLDSISDPDTQTQVVNLFRASMRTVWYVGIAFSGFGWLLVWLEKEVTLRSKLNTKFGLDEKKKNEQHDEEKKDDAKEAATEDGKAEDKIA